MLVNHLAAQRRAQPDCGEAPSRLCFRVGRRDRNAASGAACGVGHAEGSRLAEAASAGYQAESTFVRRSLNVSSVEEALTLSTL